MKNITKMVSHFLVLGLVAGGTFATAFFNSRSSQPVRALADDGHTAEAINFTTEDFSSEVEANYEELGVTISQSTLTETSQSLSVIFRSKTIIGFKNGRQTYVVQIDDPNFTGDLDDPAVDGYDHFDEETNLPIFNGVVSYILGGSGGNRDVFLPSRLVREESFVIEVSTIKSGCISADGAEYNGSNSWITPPTGDVQRIVNVYIPSTITTVESGAFTGFPTSAADPITIHVEGSSLPSGFAADWTDAPSSAIDVSPNSYKTKTHKDAKVAYTVTDLPDPYGRPVNFILGCKQDAAHSGEEFNRPLVIEYDRVITENGAEKSREKHFEALNLINSVESAYYDSCGNISQLSYGRTFSFRLGPNESIDDKSVVFHNIMKASANATIDTSVTYFAKPVLGYSEKLGIDELVHVKASLSSTFAGYSLFSLTMDKNLSITSERYPEPHSLYLDVKTDMYEQNASRIKDGVTKIRYSIQTLYNSSYHFQYIGKGGALKDVYVPIVTKINYLILDNAKGNKVSALLKDSDVAPDFSADRVVMFEITGLTIQMDLTTISDSGTVSNLGKSDVSYQFAYLTVFNKEKGSAFNWNLFLILFFIGYAIVYAGAAVGVYFFMKEKFKNDEFRRVNGKKFLKKALLGGAGLGVVIAAILFIIMRTSGFRNTIVVFNPTDPLLIAFSIVGLIIAGYFIVYMVKLVKAERERRKIIRLKLAEDVEDDGTN